MTIEDYDNSPEAQLQTAFHECGHALIAQVIGAACEGISVVRTGDMAGYFKGGSPKSTGDQQMHERAMMAFAGMIAEEVFTGKSIKMLSHGSDSFWYKYVLNRKGKDFITRAYYEARKHIVAHWPQVTQLASDLNRKKMLTGEEIANVLGTVKNG